MKKQVKRQEMLHVFRQIAACLVAMEPMEISHNWARELGKLGYEVRLIARQFVKLYVKGGKNDANDAKAICEAASDRTCVLSQSRLRNNKHNRCVASSEKLNREGKDSARK